MIRDVDMSVEQAVRHFSDGTVGVDHEVFDRMNDGEKMGYIYAHSVLEELRRLERGEKT